MGATLLQECFRFLPLSHYSILVKRKIVYRALSLSLVAVLLFSQVALNFFHDHQGYRFRAGLEQQNKTTLQKHVQHCKVCSLEIMSGLFFQPVVQPTEQIFIKTEGHESVTDLACSFTAFTQGRAPPVAIL